MLTIGTTTALLALGLLRLPAVLAARLAALVLLAAALLAGNVLDPAAPAAPIFGGLFAAGPSSQALTTVLLGAGALVMLSIGSPSRPMPSEFGSLALFAAAGGTMLLASRDLLSAYLALELQSFAGYILAALIRNNEKATAAALKYFLISSLGSAFILLGAGLVYWSTGLTSLSAGSLGDSLPPAVSLGLTLALAGWLFKVASAPFHHWAPDVYDGVPTPVASWIAVLPKVSVLGFLLVLFRAMPPVGALSGVGDALAVSAALSLVLGTVLGLAQTRAKRLLAYSTVNNVAYLLIALLALSAAGEPAAGAFVFFLAQYTLVNLAAFLALLAAGHAAGGRDIGRLSELSALPATSPGAALAIALALFGMAGVPPLVGFFGKYFVLEAALGAGMTWLAGLAILTSVIAAAYYLRVVQLVSFNAPEGQPTGEVPAMLAYSLSMLTVLALGFLAFAPFILNGVELIALGEVL
jgi:NADH-ubiquinone oxidoreductase chain 2